MTGLRDAVLALWRARALTWMMARREIASRHAGSVAGIAWVYAQPILMIGAYYLLFDVVFRMRLGEGAPVRAVGAYLVVGMLPWMAFTDAVSRGMHSLIESAGLLQKNPLPPALFPARSVLASAVIFLPLVLLLVPLYGAQHHWQAPVLAIPVLLLAQVLLSMLLAHALAILAAALRDTLQVVGFLLSVGLFLSPILFPPDLFPEGWRAVLWANPMTPWVLAYQDVLLTGEWPRATAWLGMAAWIVALALILARLAERSREQLVDWL